MTEIFSHYPLERYNTFGLKVFAREFAELKSEEEVRYIIKHNIEAPEKLLVLGGGSNILFKGDFEGLVAKISTKSIEVIKDNPDKVQVRVAAGEDWDQLVEYCVNNDWHGIENLSGIPGQVGSSPIQNIGAYGTELKDVFESVEAINRYTGEFVTYDKESCQFGYRDSIFKRALRERVLITHVVLCLRKQAAFNLSYHALKQKIGNFKENELTLRKVREAVLEIRASKLPDPGVTGNAGSFFKNPVIDYAPLEELKEEFPEIVYYMGSLNNFKLAAGWLIEHCGWKGYREGDAGVHKDQALVLVNYGNATGRDLLDLASRIQQSVREKFGVDLEREVNIV